MRNIIINADDFGLSKEVNLAIIKLLKANKIQRTTLMVNMPYALDAYEMAKEFGLLDKVGLHINLTDGVPLSKSIKSTRFCQNGILNHQEVERGTRIYIRRSEAFAVRAEVKAQFERFKELFGYYPKHVDSHRHIHNYLPFLFIIIKLSRTLGVESMRIPINLYDKKEASFAKIQYKWFVIHLVKTFFQTTDYMGAYLEYKKYFSGSELGTIEIMVHPTIYNKKIVDIIFDHDKEDYYDFDLIKI